MQILKISPTLSINYTIHKYGRGSNYSTAPTPPEDLGVWVILISGLGDTQAIWEEQITSFVNAGYTVLTYDNRGVGGSSRPATDEVDVQWTSEDMASDLRAVVKHLELPRYHVMGTSMGGMIAQTYALRYGYLDDGDDDDDDDDDDGTTTPQDPTKDDRGDRMRKDELISLVLTCTYAAPGPFCSRMFSLWRDMATNMSVADANREVLLWCFTPEWFADPTQQEVLTSMEGMMGDADEDMGLPAYLAQLNVIMTFDSRAVVGRLGRGRGRGSSVTGGPKHEPKHEHEHPMSVYVLVGERDGLIPNCVSRELCDLIDGAEWVVTKGSHACNFECPTEFNENALRCFKKAEERFWS
ncbi:hypothetical protein RBB50_002631 [Rhinocladiella similis]|jgi:3-oxoadipate enol-lactonase